MDKSIWKRAFLRLSAIVLFTTAAFKLITAQRSIPLLLIPDPIFPSLDNRQVLILSSGLELLVVGILMLRFSNAIKLTSLMWLSSCFLTYHFGLLLLGAPKGHCPCLGDLGALIAVSDAALARISFVVAALLWTGSGLLLLGHVVVPKLGRAVACVIVFGLWSSTSSHAGSLQISGVINATLYQNSSVLNERSNWFIVTIDGEHSQIQSGPMGDPAIEKFEYGMFGQDSYTLVVYATNYSTTDTYRITDGSAQKIKYPTPTRGVNGALIVLNNGGPPEYLYGLLTPVWLAYCSHVGLTNSGVHQTTMPPICSVGSLFRSKGGLAEVGYELNNRAPHFTKELIERLEPGQFKALALPLPSQETFTNLTYHVENWTNIADFEVPQIFWATNRGVTGSAGVILSAQMVYRGIVTNIVSANMAPPELHIPPITRVVEKRTNIVSPRFEFAYTTTNGLLLNRDKMVKNEDFRAELSEAHSDMLLGAYRFRKIALVTVFALLCALPIILLRYSKAGAAK